MDIRKVDSDFAVAAQFPPEDMAQLPDLGFTRVLCNRPDAEEPGQPALADMRAAAEAAGMEFHHIPVAGGNFPPEAIDAFREARQGADGKVLAYCRSGTRSITLDALANPKGLSVDERLQNAANAGYDLSGLRPHLR